MVKISVEHALNKAKSNVKKGELLEAQKLYKSVLQVFPKNVRAQQGLDALKEGVQIYLQNPPSEVIKKLLYLFNNGQLLTVFDQTQVLSAQFPQSFITWNLLGSSSVQLGKLDEAVNAYQKALYLQPNNAEVHNNIGVVFKEKGMLSEAIQSYNKAISIKPNYAEAFYNKGVAAQDHGNVKEAIKAYSKAIYFKPNYPSAYGNMGNALRDLGKLDEAIDSFTKAISLEPNNPTAYTNLGNVMKDLGKFEKSVEVHRKSILLNPNNPIAYNNLGIALKEQGKLDEAIEAYNKAISLKADYADPYSNIGNVLKEQDKLDAAIEFFNKALLIEPKHAEAYSNLGITFQEMGDLVNAIKAYKKSISLNPNYAETHENLSYALLNNGSVKEGLDEYEWRCKSVKGIARQRNFNQPVWDGKQSLDCKRMLIWSEQGIGDTINWSSHLSFISKLADKCILECPKKLVPLLQRSFPDVEINYINRSLDTKREDFDFHLPMGSLCKHFIKEISNNNKTSPHLIADPDRVKFWRRRLNSIGSGPYVGISWKSSDLSSNRLKNYSSIFDFTTIFKIPNVTFINLQYQDFKDDLAKVREELGVKVHNFDDLDHFDNIDDVAALCTALDMVVSTKTTVPLISAGVGTPTKLANWKQSAWNNILLNPRGPSVQIYERNTWETWDNIFNSIAEDILKIKNKGEADE